ncbi:aldo/keto reductase [Sedimentibacter hydroxybenzoicus DSM 7310]|uniref:Aldo/keto reductase n=2 Tax=Sedimentibacter hydroxybenzoicus TaxID=29345 RepID=A0A974BIM8_SEDHY|nr:aldo/keto reductase [Sedimentibacter hydroxybenzoicus DSM 7310]
MQYRIDPISENKLSILGFGCMRFPRSRGQIDIVKTEELIIGAVEHGINYFDTAYIYGGCEEALGEIIHKNEIRDQIYLATKLPLGKCQSPEDFDTLFNEQLDRLHTDHFDYYLMHNLSDTKLWKRLCDMGIESWLSTKKDIGQIRQIGFSFHGAQKEFMALLDLYDWDFCQIQYNYINTEYQAGAAGLKRAADKGLPVIIMEPLLGGSLANSLPQKAQKIFRNANHSCSPAEWAFRWLWNQPEITVVLSGMNAAAQLEENLKIASCAVPNMLTEAETAVFQLVVEAFNNSYKIPCTGCNYCMPCPHKVNIPGCFAAYNMSYAVGRFSGFNQYMTSTGATDPSKNYAASQCRKCGKCEKHCPQQIPIIQSLQSVKKRMEPFWYKPMVSMFIKIRERKSKNA